MLKMCNLSNLKLYKKFLIQKYIFYNSLPVPKVRSPTKTAGDITFNKITKLTMKQTYPNDHRIRNGKIKYSFF